MLMTLKSKDRSMDDTMNTVKRQLQSGVAAFLLLAGGVWLAGSPMAYAKDAPKPQTAVATHGAGSQSGGLCRVGSLRHLPRGDREGLDSNPHTRIAHMHGGNAATCEGCHGPGKAHVDGGGDVTKIFRFTKATRRTDRREVPDLPQGQPRQLPALGARRGQCQLH